MVAAAGGAAPHYAGKMRSGCVPRATDPAMVDSYFMPIGSPIPTRVAPRWGCLLERPPHLPGTPLTSEPCLPVRWSREPAPALVPEPLSEPL